MRFFRAQPSDIVPFCCSRGSSWSTSYFKLGSTEETLILRSPGTFPWSSPLFVGVLSSSGLPLVRETGADLLSTSPKVARVPTRNRPNASFLELPAEGPALLPRPTCKAAIDPSYASQRADAADQESSSSPRRWKYRITKSEGAASPSRKRSLDSLTLYVPSPSGLARTIAARPPSRATIGLTGRGASLDTCAKT